MRIEKKYIYGVDDFEGSGQWLISDNVKYKKNSCNDLEWISHHMWKVGWICSSNTKLDGYGDGIGEQIVTLTQLSDGLTFVFKGKEELVEYLNGLVKNSLRPATPVEMLMLGNFTKNRFKGSKSYIDHDIHAYPNEDDLYRKLEESNRLL